MNEKRKVVLSFLLGFTLGGALVYTGVHYCRHYWRMDHHGFWGGRHKEFSSEKILERFGKKLDLTADQKVEIGKILDSKLKKLTELRDKIRPQFKALRESTRAA
jgi:hypothetical protein